MVPKQRMEHVKNVGGASDLRTLMLAKDIEECLKVVPNQSGLLG